jgi:hypothetical protein
LTVDLSAWVTLVQNGGLALAVVVLVAGGIRGWYVFGPTYADMKQDRDDWKALALRGTSLAERALDAPPPK